MATYGKVSIARVVHSSQRCCPSCVCRDIALTSTPSPSGGPHHMLNLPGEVLIEQME